MRPVRTLAQSTPFRLAVTFAAFLIVAFILSGIVVYRIMEVELADRLDEDLNKTFMLLASTYEANDLEDLVAAVESHAALSSNDEQLFLLTGLRGERLAGNLSAAPAGLVQGTPFTVEAGVLGAHHDTEYRVYSAMVGGNRLTLAYSYAETDELRLVILSGFAWATIIAAGLAVLGGALLAARVQRRLDAIATTMDSVSRGRMDMRIPLIGKNDDIDAVSAQINGALDRIVGLMEGLRQVGVDIAHDLRTPLSRLRIIIEGALDKADQQEVVADLEDARAEVDRTTQTFDALLRIAQMEAGARRARFHDLDIGEIVEDIGDTYREVAKDYGRTVAVKSGKTVRVRGDRELLLQLLANLVENALRHTPAEARITLGYDSNAGRPEFWVCDTGPGIPSEEREKVFRRLYRMDKSRSTPGNGLGLSMIKAIADLHSAEVRLEDAKPGLLVRVVFPAA